LISMFKSWLSVVRGLVVMVAVIALTTVLVNASDNWSNLSGSVLGSVFGGGGSVSRCPEGMAYVAQAGGSFCVDIYSASADSSCPYPDPASQDETRDNLRDPNCLAVSKEGVMPWRHISQTQAQEICQKSGKFLPSSEQWYRASLGTPAGRPWGENDCQLDYNWDQSPGLTGTGSNCRSHAGTFDQVGNVWEWVDATVRNGSVNNFDLPEAGYITAVDADGWVIETDPGQPDENYTGDRLWLRSEGVRGVMRGGFFGSRQDGGVFSFHAEMDPGFVGRAVGFRCAAEVND